MTASSKTIVKSFQNAKNMFLEPGIEFVHISPHFSPQSMFSKNSLVIHQREGKSLSLGGIDVIYKILGDDTNGAFRVVEHPIGPKRLVRPHVHKNEDEISYIVEGEIGVKIGNDEFLTRAGDWIFKPRGILHTFWNLGSTNARLIEIISPPAFAHYFEELSEILVARSPPDLQKIAELDKKYEVNYNLEWVPALKEKHGLMLVGE
jgi:mannose-6-phosphate isomerase-like protein (cupin superfamily)